MPRVQKGDRIGPKPTGTGSYDDWVARCRAFHAHITAGLEESRLQAERVARRPEVHCKVCGEEVSPHFGGRDWQHRTGPLQGFGPLEDQRKARERPDWHAPDFDLPDDWPG